MSVSEDALMADDLSSIAGDDHHPRTTSPCPIHSSVGGGLVGHIRRMRSANAKDDAPDTEFVVHRRCTCSRKGQLPDLRHEAAVARDNTKRHAKTQGEQLRQYKDEARHLSKVSRAFREENSRLQRVLEEKGRLAADASDRAVRERRKHMDVDTERAAWFVRMDDLRDENGLLTGMAAKSRSEADHLRAALDQAMGENLKLRSALTSSSSTPPPPPAHAHATRRGASPQTGPSSLFLNNQRRNNDDAEHRQQQQQQQQQRPSSITAKSSSHKTASTAPAVVGGHLPPAQQRPTASSSLFNTGGGGGGGATITGCGSASAATGLAEDLNNLRNAVNLVRRAGCTCHGGGGGAASSSSPQREPSSPPPAVGAPGTSLRDRCSVGVGKHRFSPAEGGGPLLSPSEKLDEALDTVRRRVFAMERELAQAAADAERWQNSAVELKNILDSANNNGGRATVPALAHPNAVSRTSGKVDVPGPNPRSATAGVTNLESQLEWAKGQIATLDFQLQTAHQHMKVELEKLRQQKDSEIERARQDASREVEGRLRDEVRSTTSGAFLEELSGKLQAAERRIETLEMSLTASEGTRKKQEADIEALSDRLERVNEVAVQLEPTQRELAQAIEDRRVLDIRLRNSEGTADALRSTEARCAEEISALRVRASKAEDSVAQLQDTLNQTALKLHLEVEANGELKERIEDTVARYEASARRNRQQMEGELHSTQERLRTEAVQRVHEEARASALENNLRSVREEVERIRRVQLHW